MENIDDLTEISPPIQYLLIGDISTNKIITEFSSTINSSKIKKEINQIFSKICKNQTKKYNERNKITSKDTIYYYTLIKPNLIFITLVEDEYPEELVFELIDKINEEKITTMINEETQELNPNGRVELKNIIDSYQKKNDENDKDKNDNINIDNKLIIEEKKISSENEMQSQNTDDIEDFQNKNDIFLMTNKKRLWDFRYINFFKNYKVWIYMATIVLIILIIVIII
jgi:hypothetical protein